MQAGSELSGGLGAERLFDKGNSVFKQMARKIPSASFLVAAGLDDLRVIVESEPKHSIWLTTDR